MSDTKIGATPLRSSPNFPVHEEGKKSMSNGYVGNNCKTSKQPAKAEEARTWQTKGRPNLSSPCGEKHQWKQWTKHITHCTKYRCEREGCGFFKKCWKKCEDIDCKGCHVPAHKRW